MRIDKERVKEKPSEKAEYFGEFSKTEIASLFPASELLQKIHTDHVYTSNEYLEKNSPDEADDLSDYTHQDDILSLNADSIQEVFQRMITMTSLNTINDQTKDRYVSTGSSPDKVCSERKTPVTRKVKFVDDLNETSDDQLASTSGPRVESSDKKARKRNYVKETGKRKTRACRKVSYSQKSTTSNAVKDEVENGEEVNVKTTKKKKDFDSVVCRSVNENEWRAANRCAEIEREMNALIQYTAELLVRRWGEYLAMTIDQISVFEIENAKQHKMVEEVIDMLEDKDRYVWQLIEDLQFL